MTIGKRIKECRVKMGMTQEELAARLYIPKSTLSAYERDVVDMKMSAIQQIAKELHTTAGYLIEGEKVELDADVMRLVSMLQDMSVEFREAAVEQVKIVAKLAEGLNKEKK